MMMHFLNCQSFLAKYSLTIDILIHLFLGTSVVHWLGNIREKVDISIFQCAARILVSFMVKLVAFFRLFASKLGRKRNIVHPSNMIESNTSCQTQVGDDINEEDRLLPCIERLQRLEKALEELSHKPAEIPLDKERMLLESLDRIKSVEFDLDKTKRVSHAPLVFESERTMMAIHVDNFLILLEFCYRYFMLQ